jgi:hypothetical protein
MKRSAQRFVNCHLAQIAEACFLAAEWQTTSWDAHRESDPDLAAQYLRSAKKYRHMEKMLRRIGADMPCSIDSSALQSRIRLIVCAAIRHRESGLVVCGARHGDCIASAIRYGLDVPIDRDIWECGFTDRDGNFLTRGEAWKVADAAGQIRRPTGLEKHYDDQREPNVGDEGLLASENLY